jgi:hypothetical protein
MKKKSSRTFVKNSKLNKELEMCKQALEFYANVHNWVQRTGEIRAVEYDHGALAKYTLMRLRK